MLDNLGGYGVGVRVAVTGLVDPECATVCMQGDGCLHNTSIERCDEEPLFHRGDANGDGSLDISDGIYLLGALFLQGPALECLEAADADDSGQLEVTDAIVVFTYLFLGGVAPAAPGPPGLPCGTDPPSSLSKLGCASYPKC